jgi:hypothetical protein
MSGSEVALLRQQIEDEIEAMKQGFAGYATTTSHKIIEHKYRQLEQYQEQLGELIGEKEAVTFVTETYGKVME